MNPAVFSEEDFAAVDEDQSQVNEPVMSAAVAQSQRPDSQWLAISNSDPLPSTSHNISNFEPVPSTSHDIGNFEPLPSTSRGTDNFQSLPSTSRGIRQDLEMDNSVLIQYTPNVEQEQLLDINYAVSPSLLSELQEEANLSPNTNPTNVLFMVKDKTVPEPTTVNPSTTSSISTDVQEQSLFPDPTKSKDFAKVLSVVSPLPNISNRNKVSRQKQHSVILSSTPMKKVFEEKEKKRLEKKCKTKINAKKKEDTSNKEKKCTAGKRKKRNTATNKKEKVRRVAKKLFEDETDMSEEEDV